MDRLQGNQLLQLRGTADAVAAFHALLTCTCGPSAETASLVSVKDALLQQATTAPGLKLDANLQQWTASPSPASVPTLASALRSLCLQGCLAIQTLLERVVIPILAAGQSPTEDAALEGPSSTPGRLTLFATLLRLLFLSDREQDKADVSLCALRENLLLPGTPRDVELSCLLRIAGHVADLVISPALSCSSLLTETELATLLSSLLSQDSVRKFLIVESSLLRDEVNVTLPAERRLEALALVLIIVREEAPTGIRQMDDPTGVNFSPLVATAVSTGSSLGTAVLVEEIGVMLSRLAAVASFDAAKQRKAEKNVQGLAAAVFEPLLTQYVVDKALPHGLRPWKISGPRFRAAIVEIGICTAAGSLIEEHSQRAAMETTSRQLCILHYANILGCF